MRYSLLILLIALQASLLAQPSISRYQHIVDSVYAADPKAVGFMVHIEAPDQHIKWSYANGYTDRATKEKLSSDNTVLIASNTKPYVCASILRLMEKGKLTIEEPISKVLTTKTIKILSAAGYNTDSISIKHLLSHTSGIRDYVDEGYFKFIDSSIHHEWTRDEQIARAASLGGPIAKPGAGFKYADVNFVLLTEIIEVATKKKFYSAMRSLLDYKKLHLKETWFAKLESKPKHAMPRAHQYIDEFGWDTYDLDPSWDLYGGGGMISTVTEMALFFQQLFNGQVIHDKNILALMYQDVPPNLEINYCLGIRKIKYSGLLGYNHGGGLGTDVIYIPSLNATIAVAALEAGHRPNALAISKEIVRLLNSENNLQGK